MSNQITQEKIPSGFALRYQFTQQQGLITDITWSPDGWMLAIADSNNTVRICDADNGNTIWKLNRDSSISSMAWSPDAPTLAVGCGDTTIRLVNTNTGKFRRRILRGHSDQVWNVEWSPDGRFLASNSRDSTIRIWDKKTGKLHQTLETHSGSLRCSMVWSPDGRSLVSASCGVVSFWDSETGELRGILKGEIGLVNSMALSPDKQHLAIASNTVVQIWNLRTGKPIGILEGHAKNVTCISFSCDGCLLSSKSNDGTIRLWRCDIWEKVEVFPGQSDITQARGVAFHPTAPVLAILSEFGEKLRVWNININRLLNISLGFESIRYRNAKVVLVGDQTVGKTALGMVLAGEEYKATDSTHGRHVWSLGATRHESKEGIEETREILLWDLAGQEEFHLIHQLSLDQTNVALVLFNGSSRTDPYHRVDFWNKALRQAKGSEHLVKYLVAARTDTCILTVTDDRMNADALEKGFQGAFCTSAKTGEGVKELRQQLEKAIDWDNLPFTLCEHLLKQMKDFIVNQKQNGHILKTATDIMQQFRIISEANFEDEEFCNAIERVEAHDLVKILSFGDYVLLQPELLDNYASAMAIAARKQPDGLGCLEEQAAREGKFNFGSLEREAENEERIILQSVVELFITKELAILDEGKLVFPSQFNRELPKYPDVEGSTVTYQFEGALLNVYATLVVRLYYSEAFKKESLWKNAAIFLPYGLEGEVNRCGFILKELAEGTGQITVFFGVDVPDATKILFLKYVHEHLRRRALDGSVKRERIYCCPKCQEEVLDRKAVKVRLDRGLTTITCNYCDAAITLSDLIEETFANDDQFITEVRQMDRQIDANLDNASKRIILEGEFMSLVGKAGQIPRLITNDDNGIDGEIEFRNDKGEASGEKIYVQLKSGNSYLKRRKKDGAYTFQIEKERHIEYWQSHRYDVYLIVRDSDEKLYWMNITQYLRKLEDKKTRTIVFNREELTVKSLRDLKRARLAQVAKVLKPVSIGQEEAANLNQKDASS
jgi:small GTP-binding protein